jgi:hypothetical protein
LANSCLKSSKNAGLFSQLVDLVVEWFGQQLFVKLQNAGFVSELVDLINISPDCGGGLANSCL